MLRSKAAPLVACALALWAQSAQALVMEGLSREDLTRHADAVVRAVVIDHTTHNVERRGLWTDFDVKVIETIKGSPRAGEHLSIGQFGGTLNGRTQTIPGDAVLRSGEEVIVFLRKVPQGFVLTEFCQAKFHVEHDPIAGAALVSRDFGATAFVQRGPGGAKPAAPPENQVETLDDFRAEIQSYVKVSR